MQKSFLGRGTWALMLGVGMAGCSLEQADESETLQESKEDILNGSPVASDTWGSPSLSGGNCSATLLRDRWILTARHCAVTAGVSVAMRDGTTAQVVNPIYNHPTLDVAVARISAPLYPSGAATTSGPYPLYRGSAAYLLNKTLYCQGWGASSCGPSGCAGGGTLRSANLFVDQVNTPDPTYCIYTSGPECYRLQISGGRLEAPGDSGGGCLATSINVQKMKVTGVQSTWNGSTHNWQPSAPNFRDWVNGIIGSAPSLGALSGFERADVVSSIMYVNGSQHVIEVGLGSGNWGRSDLTTHTGSVNASSNLSSFVRQDGNSSTVFRSADNHIRELTLVHDGAWSHVDLSALTGASAAAGDPAAYSRSDLAAAVVYRGTDSRIREISRAPGANWSVGDLNTITGAPLAASDPVGYVRADGVSSVVYRSADNHIRELTLPIGGWWSTADLTAITGAVNATGKPRPYTRSDGVTSVLYRSSDNHIRELTLNGGAWAAFDLTVAAGAPLAASEPFGYVRSDGVSVVIYKSADNRIRELGLNGGTWTSSDLTAASGAPLATGTGLSAFVRADRANSVIFRTSDSHVHEISLAKGAFSWFHADLTNIVGAI
jgi:hypothetical protein